uniref:Homoserine dehydrogenase n=2 Tax=Pseudo-nitzschia australis TaxID=44445 RepID=A0A7S4ALR0_9STRA|mmetsp:Transcript_2351/g.5065  ORF Transcript_2351/g.5065 Transcript_2351/m.5065 type:complete len:480 (+) Transcript_2351:152-1591(+)
MKFLLSTLSVLAMAAPSLAFVPPSIPVQRTASSISALNMEEVKIGIFGGGTVGGGIVEIIESKREHFQKMTGKNLSVKTICVRDLDKPRDFAVPEGCKVTTEFDDILGDASLDIIVEVMGGTTLANDVVCTALGNGKHIVTANKALIAEKLAEIESLVIDVNKDREGDDTVEFRYEAAVCGGIPIIRSLQSDVVGDEIEMLSGIINGCTNFMLTAMDVYGKSYDEALSEASDLGYAEADPTLDVGGFDARSKLKILMRLAYGIDVDEDDISCRGITELTKLDFQYAKMMGGTIKLVGVAKAVSDGKVAAFVSPAYITQSDSLFSVSGATNAVELISKNLQTTTLIGQGAGRFPTANSCINDIVSLAKGDKTPLPFNPPADNVQFVNNYESNFFIRLKYRDALGITRQVGEVCEKYGVSIHSILQNPITSRDDAAFAIITERVPISSVKKFCAEIEDLDWCRGPSFYMPVLREDWESDLV